MLPWKRATRSTSRPAFDHDDDRMMRAPAIRRGPLSWWCREMPSGVYARCRKCPAWPLPVPAPRQQVVGFCAVVVRDACKDFCEPGVGSDFVELSRFDQSIGDGCGPTIQPGADERVVLARQGNGTHDPDAVLTHRAPNPADADADAQLIQLLGHAWPAVAAQAQPVSVADMGEEHHVASLAMRRGPVLQGRAHVLRRPSGGTGGFGSARHDTRQFTETSPLLSREKHRRFS